LKIPISIQQIRENLFWIPITGFILLLGVALLSFAWGWYYYGIVLNGTLPILPYYSPHKYNVIIYCVFFLTVFDWRYGKKAVFYFFAIYMTQEALDDIFTTVPQMLTGSNIDYGFLSSPPYNGGIIWIAQVVFIATPIILFAYLRPRFEINTWYKWLMMGFWIWINRGYINQIVIDSQTGQEIVEILRNTSGLIALIMVIKPKQ